MAAAFRAMDPSAALSGLRCTDCDRRLDATGDARACPDCGGPLVATYEYDAVSPARTAVGGDFLAESGLSALLGVPESARPELGQGETPLIDAPALAEELGVGHVACKDEGQNPTGGLVDRELALAVGAAAAAGATTVALPTMGNAGQAAAAAAARTGLDSHSFVPSRTPFVNKAMINVHGGDMTVVEGRYRDAVAAYREAAADESWYPVGPFETPHRQEGVKPFAYELAAARDWSSPDWVVVPTGQVTPLVGIDRGFRDLEALGLVESRPRLVAAQAAGCAPLASAVEAGADDPAAVEHPDTVVGPLEIPDPAGGRIALEALAESDGTAIAVEDPEILAGAQTLAEAGLPASVTAGAGLAAARVLAEQNAFAADEAVVLVNPVAGSKEADLLRSHLMSQGR